MGSPCVFFFYFTLLDFILLPGKSESAPSAPSAKLPLLRHFLRHLQTGPVASSSTRQRERLTEGWRRSGALGVMATGGATTAPHQLEECEIKNKKCKTPFSPFKAKSGGFWQFLALFAHSKELAGRESLKHTEVDATRDFW